MNSTYKIELSKVAKKYLKRLDKSTIIRIISAIESIRETPRSHPNTKKMKGYNAEVYRLRVGEYRILYEIVDEQILS